MTWFRAWVCHAPSWNSWAYIHSCTKLLCACVIVTGKILKTDHHHRALSWLPVAHWLFQIPSATKLNITTEVIAWPRNRRIYIKWGGCVRSHNLPLSSNIPPYLLQHKPRPLYNMGLETRVLVYKYQLFDHSSKCLQPSKLSLCISLQQELYLILRFKDSLSCWKFSIYFLIDLWINPNS